MHAPAIAILQMGCCIIYVAPVVSGIISDFVHSFE